MKPMKFLVAALTVLSLGLAACGGGDTDNSNSSNSDKTTPSTKNEKPADNGKGIGPVKNVEINEGIDEQLAQQGLEIFEAKCTACHQFEGKYVGPGLQGVTDRRSPEWIMNMILNPEEMTKKDPTAKKLFEEHLTQMTFQDVTREDARAILELFRKHDSENQ